MYLCDGVGDAVELEFVDCFGGSSSGCDGRGDDGASEFVDARGDEGESDLSVDVLGSSAAGSGGNADGGSEMAGGSGSPMVGFCYRNQQWERRARETECRGGGDGKEE